MSKQPEPDILIQLNEHIGILYKICQVFFHTQADRDDARQEMLYQLWKSYPGFKGNSSFSTWMYKVAFNTAINWQTRQVRRHDTPPETRDAADPDRELDQAEKITRLYSAIHQLTMPDKAITLLYLEGYPYQEIASIIGISTSNVSVRLVRIKQILKTRLNNDNKNKRT